MGSGLSFEISIWPPPESLRERCWSLTIFVGPRSTEDEPRSAETSSRWEADADVICAADDSIDRSLGVDDPVIFAGADVSALNALVGNFKLPLARRVCATLDAVNMLASVG